MSKKGKEKMVESSSKRRPFTRSDSKKMMNDAMKASAKSTTKNWSARTFKVSNFKIPLSDVVDVSGGESDERSGKKRSGKIKQGEKKKVEKTKSTKVTMIWLRFNCGCIYSTTSLVFFMKKRYANSTTRFYFRKMEASKPE